ncbi:MAG: hypothetical protein JWN21_2314 [Sphingomonas bacterium]|uniref:hypothetical protein n=1 Tax=Sphingomonas bacterium TaxID=1895847 RepID=UPI00262FEAEE|nr:hypothetical protein [Sphingomonas bacterium]MDB5696771.1 hypothetical protein [Sphingomonas bacterium]
MKNAILLLTAAALLPLAACNSKQEAANAAAAANEAAAANLAAIELPPAIKADKSFRCKDNSLAFVTFFEGDTQAVVKDAADATGTLLKAATAGEPLTAEGGWSMTGDSEKGVTLTRPGKSAIECHS